MAKPPVKHLSYSSLELWLKCPRQWKFRYVDGMDSAPWVAAWAGSAFHKWVEDWEVQKMEPETFRFYLDDQIEKERSKTDLEPRESGGLSLEDWSDFGVALCEKWVSWRTSEDREILGSEVEFLVPLPGLRLPVKGFVDALFDLVIDWKTGIKMPTPTQLKIYGAILRALGWPQEKGAFYNARTGKLATLHDLDYTIEDVVALFKPLDDGIHEGVYPPNPDYHCKWCPGLSQCSEGMRRVGRPNA